MKHFSDCTCEDCLGDLPWIEAILADNTRLAARVKELKEALRQYGDHVPTCQAGTDAGGNPRGCDCGLSAALAAKEEA